MQRIVRTHHFWIVVLMLAVSAFLHYFTPQLRFPPLTSFPLTRHAVERIIFILPIAGAAFAFGQVGGLITLVAAVIIMLPRVFFISAYPLDSFVETVGVAVVSYVMIWMIETQENEKKLRQKVVEELETLNAVAFTLSQSLNLDEILNTALGKVLEAMGAQAKGGIFLLDAEGQKLHLRAHKGLSPEFSRREIEVATADLNPELFDNDFLETAHLARGREMDLYGNIIVPLKSRDKVQGAMFLYVHDAYQADAKARRLYASIGRQIGVAVENAQLHQNVARQLQIEQRLNEVAEKITSELELDKILPVVLQIAEELIGADGGIIALLDRERDVIGYPYLHNLPQELAEITVAKGEGLAGDIMTTGRPTVIEDYRTYPNAVPVFVEAGVTSVVAVPIASGDQMFGALAVVSLDETKLFSQRDMAILAGIGRQAGIAIENARLYENMRFYVRQITRAQENERRRIARELHDETAQALIALSRRLDDVVSDEPLPQSTVERLERLQELLDGILQGVRRFSRALRPSVLDDLGLLPALEGLMDDVKADRIEGELQVHGDRYRLPSETELVLFRIVQEALNNVRRHSQASQVKTAVEFGEGMVRITIEDNGQGFDLPTRTGDLAAMGKLGLVGMRERAQLLGGTVTVQSKLGRGTSVIAEVPA